MGFSISPSLTGIARLFDRLVTEGPLNLTEAAAILWQIPKGNVPARKIGSCFRQLILQYPRFLCRDEKLYPFVPFWYETPWLILDLETTGGDPERGAEVIELALYKVQGSKLLERRTLFFKPRSPLPEWISTMSGIRPEMLEGAAPFSSSYGEIVSFMSDLPWFAHNLEFDLRFLQEEARELGSTLPSGVGICTLKMARRLYDSPSYSLENLARSLYLPLMPNHRAEVDVQVTWIVLLHLFLSLPLSVTDFSGLSHWISQRRGPRGRERAKLIKGG